TVITSGPSTRSSPNSTLFCGPRVPPELPDDPEDPDDPEEPEEPELLELCAVAGGAVTTETAATGTVRDSARLRRVLFTSEDTTKEQPSYRSGDRSDVRRLGWSHASNSRPAHSAVGCLPRARRMFLRGCGHSAAVLGDDGLGDLVHDGRDP